MKWESKPDTARSFSRVNCILESLRNGSSALKFRSLPRHREQNDESISCPSVFLYFSANICILVRPLRREPAQHFPRGNEAAALRLICSLDPFQFRDGLIFQVPSHISGTDLQLSFQQFSPEMRPHNKRTEKKNRNARYCSDHGNAGRSVCRSGTDVNDWGGGTCCTYCTYSRIQMFPFPEARLGSSCPTTEEKFKDCFF